MKLGSYINGTIWDCPHRRALGENQPDSLGYTQCVVPFGLQFSGFGVRLLLTKLNSYKTF